MAGIGVATMEMVTAWLDHMYPDAAEGSVKTGALLFTSAGEAAAKSEIMLEALNADPRINLVFTKETDGIVEANTAMSEALTVDPDIQLMVTFDDSGAVGANQIWVSQSGVDFDTCAVLAGSYSDSLGTLIAQSGTETSLVRGGIQQGGLEQEYYDFVYGMQTLLEMIEAGTAFTMPLGAITSFGYSSLG